MSETIQHDEEMNQPIPQWPRMVCPTCDGKGYHNVYCETCEGRGWVIDPEAIEIGAESEWRADQGEGNYPTEGQFVMVEWVGDESDPWAKQWYRKRFEAGLVQVMEAGP